MGISLGPWGRTGDSPYGGACRSRRRRGRMGPPDPKDLVKAELVAETTSTAPGVDALGRSSSRDQTRAGTSTGGIPAIPACRRRSTGNCRRVFGRANLVGRCPSILCKAESAITATPARPIFSFRSASRKKSRQAAPTVLAAEASWLVCAEICIPGSASLSLSLPVAAGPAAPDPAVAALFAAVRRQLPTPGAVRDPLCLRRRMITGCWFRQAPSPGCAIRPGRFFRSTVR